MTAPARQRIDFIQSTYDEVEKELLAGKTPAEVADYLGESVGNVMGVWADLRNAGKVEARNFTPTAVPSSTGSMRPTQDVRPPATASLIERGQKHPLPKIRGLADKAHKALAALHAALEDDAGKAAARAEVARLEAQLAAAKAKLKGTTTVTPAAASKPTSTGTHPCRADGCDRTFDSGQGRALHERRAHEPAA